MITAIIVDDEPNSCRVLATLLEKYCPEVSLLASCQSAEEAMKVIRQQAPALVFLDVEMPHMNGFEMLEQLSDLTFDLIFTTSYDHYALKAIRFSAIDYLLKPIDRDELQNAVQKVVRRSRQLLSLQMEVLLQRINHPGSLVNKIALPTIEGLQMINVADIICCESDSNYTTVQLKKGQKLVVARTLKEIEELLDEHGFLRVHHSYLANLNEINRYVRGEGGYLVMSDGSHIDVSRTRKETVLRKLLPSRD